MRAASLKVLMMDLMHGTLFSPSGELRANGRVAQLAARQPDFVSGALVACYMSLHNPKVGRLRSLEADVCAVVQAGSAIA